jgi:hypothetical protein
MSASDRLRICFACAVLWVSAASGQIWTPTGAPIQGWNSIASSADGTKLLGGGSSGSTTYRSTNSGSNWTFAVADGGMAFSSTNGSNLALAVKFSSIIGTSTDAGNTWQFPTTPDDSWRAIAGSADGTKLVVASDYDPVALGGAIFRSVNGGSTWSLTGAPSNDWYWAAISSSADGTKLVAAPYDDPNTDGGGPIFYSLNSGATWLPSDSPEYTWTSVSASADGTRLIAVAQQSEGAASTPIYLSADSGANWTPSGNFSNFWLSAGCSANGSNLIAIGQVDSYGPNNSSDLIYTSTNFGASWNLATAPPGSLGAVASSADGFRHFATTFAGGIYTDASSSPWSETGAAATNLWQAITASVDGTQLVAAAGGILGEFYNFGQIYRSTNSGATWSPTQAPGAPWSSLASSADGRTVLAVSPAWVYTSLDGGVDWTSNNLPGENWVSGACSSNGSNMVVVAQGFGGGIPGLVYVSTDAGVTWNPSTGAANTGWAWVASSANGSNLVAAVNELSQYTPPYPPGYIYTSSDGGMTWNSPNSPPAFWTAVASSSDGTRLIAAASSDGYLRPVPIYTSTNSGSNWVANNTAPGNWYAVSSSADGTRLAAASASGTIYYSTNSGGTWTTNTAPFQQWHSVAWSGNGNALFGASFFGGIYSVNFPGAALLPALKILISGRQALLTWPTNAGAAFHLQQNSSVLTTNWLTLTNVPQVTNALYRVATPSTNPIEFFRLKSP